MVRGALLLSLASCGARAELEGPPSPSAAGTARSCLPACLADYLASCVAPAGACDQYSAALPLSTRFCFASGATIREAESPTGWGYRIADTRECVLLQRTAEAATVDVYRWLDRDGAELASVLSGQSLGRRWRVRCDGATHDVDPDSAACAGDPWARVLRPYEYPCTSSGRCLPR